MQRRVLETICSVEAFEDYHDEWTAAELAEALGEDKRACRRAAHGLAAMGKLDEFVYDDTTTSSSQRGYVWMPSPEWQQETGCVP